MAKRGVIIAPKGVFDADKSVERLPSGVGLGDEFYGREGTPYEGILFRVCKAGAAISSGYKVVQRVVRTLAANVAANTSLRVNSLRLTVTGPVDENVFAGGKLLDIANKKFYVITANSGKTGNSQGTIDVDISTPLTSPINTSNNLVLKSTGFENAITGAADTKFGGVTMGNAIAKDNYFAAAIEGDVPVPADTATLAKSATLGASGKAAVAAAGDEIIGTFTENGSNATVIVELK